MLIRLLPLGLLVFALGCDAILGPNEQRVVGIVEDFATGDPGIEIPATVKAGQDFTVTVYTGWGNGCARKGETQVRAEGMTATVTPYDLIREYALCTDAPVRIAHTATLRFSEPGEARVIVRGRASSEEGVSTVQRDIIVE